MDDEEVPSCLEVLPAQLLKQSFPISKEVGLLYCPTLLQTAVKLKDLDGEADVAQLGQL